MHPVRAVALVALCGLASAQDRATLFHRPVPIDDVLLPAEAWRAVGASIEVRGVHFRTERGAPNELGVDTDGDGEIDSRLGGQGGRVALAGLELRAPSELGADPVRAPFSYAVQLRRHATRGWQWASSGCLVARVRGQGLRLFDQDGNGRFGDFGVDALAIGDDPAATLLSRVIHLNGALVHLELLDDEREVRVTPFAGPTGFVDAKSGFASTGRLLAAIVQDGDLSFDLAAGKGALELPAGNYRLVSGLAVAGEESVRMRAGRMSPVRVDADAHIAIAWGAPVTAEFQYRVDGSTIVVEPDVAYFGRGGEEYFAFWPCARSPQLAIHHRETGEKVQTGTFGGSCGGGLSRFQAIVPEGVPLEVHLEHERALFGRITGSSHRDTTQAGRH